MSRETRLLEQGSGRARLAFRTEVPDWLTAFAYSLENRMPYREHMRSYATIAYDGGP